MDIHITDLERWLGCSVKDVPVGELHERITAYREWRAEQDRLTAKAQAARDRLTAEAKAARDAESREVDERLRREREEQERVTRAQERATAEALLADDARRRGETPEALRAVAAWRRKQAGAITFRMKEGPARDALLAADATLLAEITTRAQAIAEAHMMNQDVGRALRNEPPVPVLPPLDVTALIDEEAVARWLVSHRAELTTFSPGWWADDWLGRDEDGDDLGTRRQFHDAAGFGRNDALVRRLARWTVATEFLASSDPVIRAAAPTVLLRETLPSAVMDQIARALNDWLVRSADDAQAEAEPQTARTARPKVARAPRDRGLRRRISDMVLKFHAEHRPRWPSMNEICENVRGKRATVLATVRMMVEENQLQHPDENHGGYWVDG